MDQFAEEFGQYFDVAESGADFDLEIGSDGITRYVGQRPDPLDTGTEDQLNPFAIAGEADPEGAAATVAGFGLGLPISVLMTIPDLVSLPYQIAEGVITAEEGQVLDSVLKELQDIPSAQIGSFLQQKGKDFGFSDETVDAFSQGYLGGELSSIIVNAVPGMRAIAKIAGAAKTRAADALDPRVNQPITAPQPVGGAADAETGQFIMTKDGEFIQSVGYQSTKPDFQKLLDSKADSQTLEQHPHVENTTNEMLARPTNDEVAGDAFETPEWEASREYTTEAGEKLKGYDGAVEWLLNHARTFAWTDSDMVPPANPVKQDKELIIIVGPPAAGKSTLANPIARQKGAMIVDADEAKKLIPGYDNGVGANVVHEESSAINKIVFNSAIETGGNIVLPVVGGNPTSLANKYIGPAKELGYRVTLVDMMVDPEVALQRMYSRFASKDRLIPPEVAKVGTDPTKAFDELVEQGAADAYTKIDNNPGKGEPRIVIRDDDNLIESAGIDARRLEQPTGKSGSKDGPADVQRDGEADSPKSNGKVTGRRK